MKEYDSFYTQLRPLLAGLLNITDLYSGEKIASVDEYRLAKSPCIPELDSDLSSCFEDTRKYLLNEPRLCFIREIILALLISGSFYNKGRKVNITGFSIKDKAPFIVRGRTNPGSIIQLFRKKCRIHCEYCYQDGVPSDFLFNVKKMDDEEILDRIKYFEKSSELFPRVIYNVDETMSHPLFFKGLTSLREKTEDPFSIYTNGENLTEENTARLSALMPVMVNLSISSVNPDTRMRVTKDKNPWIAINGIKELYKNRIPFDVSLVAWPTISLDDLQSTISHFDEFNPLYMKVILPGYTKFFKKPFTEDSFEHNSKVIEFIRSIRHNYKSDIIFDLNKLEEILYGLDPLEPRISYIVPNSPGYKAELKKGDVIYSIMGKKVLFRNETSKLINSLPSILKKTDIVLVIKDENGNKQDRIIKREYFSEDYPFYTWQTDLGIHIDYGLDPGAIVQINNLISSSKSKNVLFLSSYLMEYSLNKIIRTWINLKKGVNFNISLPKNYYWGGNIFVGDLLTVDDFISAIKEALIKYPETDLVIIPSSPFSSWKRDLKGDLFYKIQRHFDTRIELLNYPRMFS